MQADDTGHPCSRTLKATTGKLKTGKRKKPFGLRWARKRLRHESAVFFCLQKQPYEP